MKRVYLVGLLTALLACLAFAPRASAASGDNTWSHTLPQAAYTMAATDGRLVFAAGRIWNEDSGTLDLLVDAWNPVSGQLVWRNQYDSGGQDGAGYVTDPPFWDDFLLVNDTLRVDGGRLIVGGFTCATRGIVPCDADDVDLPGIGNPLVQVLDKDTGVVLWRRSWVTSPPDGAGGVTALDAAAGRVVAGQIDDTRAFGGRSGNPLWTRSDLDWVSALELAGSRLFLGGAEGDDLVTRALVPATGATLWSNHDPRPESYSTMGQLAVVGSRVIGISNDNHGTFTEFHHVRAMAQTTGATNWDTPGSGAWTTGGPLAMATTASRVFTAGWYQPALEDVTTSNFMVRAYDTKTGATLWTDIAMQGRVATANAIAYATIPSRRLPVFGGLEQTTVRHEVVAVGSGSDASGTRYGLVRAHDEKTGSLLWERQVAHAGRHDDLLAVVSVRGGLVAVGTTSPFWSSDDEEMRLSRAGAIITAYVP